MVITETFDADRACYFRSRRGHRSHQTGIKNSISKPLPQPAAEMSPAPSCLLGTRGNLKRSELCSTTLGTVEQAQTQPVSRTMATVSSVKSGRDPKGYAKLRTRRPMISSTRQRSFESPLVAMRGEAGQHGVRHRMSAHFDKAIVRTSSTTSSARAGGGSARCRFRNARPRP